MQEFEPVGCGRLGEAFDLGEGKEPALIGQDEPDDQTGIDCQGRRRVDERKLKLRRADKFTLAPTYSGRSSAAVGDLVFDFHPGTRDA